MTAVGTCPYWVVTVSGLSVSLSSSTRLLRSASVSRWFSPVLWVGSLVVCWWEICVSAVIVRSSAVCLKSGDAGASVRYSCATLPRSASRWWCSSGA